MDVKNEHVTEWKYITGKEGHIGESTIHALGQQAFPLTTIFKVFSYLLNRIEAIEQKNAQPISAHFHGVEKLS